MTAQAGRLAQHRHPTRAAARAARRRCYWCGVRRAAHADLGPAAAVIGPGICPTWMPPPPWPIRVVLSLTGAAPKHPAAR